ncbi:MAG: YdiY family protein [Elusimicrobiota bacterium]
MNVFLAMVSLVLLGPNYAYAQDVPPPGPPPTAVAASSGVAVSSGVALTCPPPVAVPCLPPPPPPPAKKWKDSAEASFVNTNGNTKTQSTSLKNSYAYDFSKTARLEQEAGGLGARSQGQQTAEQYFAGEKLQRKYDDRDYVFEKYRWDKNRFAGVVNRQEASVGVGRYLVKTATDTLTFEAAPGYLNQQSIGAKRESVATSRAFARYEHVFTPTSKFSQSVEEIQSLANKRDSRINTETALTTAINAHFSVKTSYTWNHVTQPPPGVYKDDEITSFALIATF